MKRPAQELGSILGTMLNNGSAQLGAMAQRAYALGRPDAAREAVQHVMQLYQVAQVKSD